MQDQDRETLAEHGRQLADLQRDMGEVLARLGRIECDVSELKRTVTDLNDRVAAHGHVLRAIMGRLDSQDAVLSAITKKLGIG